MSSMCPGFKPHGVKPTRCRRCFKEFSDHPKKDEDDLTTTYTIRRSPSTESKDNSPTKTQTEEATGSSRFRSRLRPEEATAASDTTASGKSKGPGPGTRKNKAKDTTAKTTTKTTTTGVRTRVRPSAIDLTPPSPPSSSSSSSSLSSTRVRQRGLRLEPDGADEDSYNRLPSSSKSASPPKSPKRIRIIATEQIGDQMTAKTSTIPDENSPDVEFILKVKTAREIDFDQESIATETTETTLTGDLSSESLEEYQSKIAALNKQVEESENQIKRLEKEKSDLQSKLAQLEQTTNRPKIKKTSDIDKESIQQTAGELVKLRAKLRELETANSEIKDENQVLKIEVKEYKQEVQALKKDNPKELKETVTNLRLKLQRTELECQELKEENEEIKKDVKALETEFQELHDNFREDQASEFRVLKRELESTAKNCRVLQFKLKKSDRMIELLEAEKADLEKKVKDLDETSKMDVDKRKMKELEDELEIAKEVSLKLHSEIEALKEERIQMEMTSQNRGGLTPDSKSKNRLSIGSISPASSFENKDYEAVVRDLYDTMEREKDLQEQLKFAEEESRTMRKKLSTMEQENEILMMQIRKMANKKAGLREDDDNEELSPEEMKLHLELYEQEMIVLRKKTDELEQENDNFQTEIKYLQDKLISQPLTKIELPSIPESSPPNVIYEHKIRLLEAEARDLRKKLVDREKENESLRTEVDVHRRKSMNKTIVRTRSLDSEQQIDLKRQLQLVEQEATILRQKILSLESDNDKLTSENKRLQLRISRKPPPGPADQMQLENLELKEKLSKLERKCESFKGDLMASKSQPNINRWETMTPTENELINSLKKTIRTKEEEATTMKARLSQLEVELTKQSREYKKMADQLCYKKRPPKVIRETATRMELKDIVKELEEEIGQLQGQLRAKDMVTENLQEDLSESRRQLDQVQVDQRANESVTEETIATLNKEIDRLKYELDDHRNKSRQLQSKLDLMAKDGGDLTALDRVETLQAEKKQLALELDDRRQELAEEKSKVHDLKEKLEAVSKTRQELFESSNVLQMKKEQVEEELDVCRDRLKKIDQAMKELEEKMRKTESENKSLGKENAGLKKELDQAKSKSPEKTSANRPPSPAVQKENDELKRKAKDLQSKIDSLTKELDNQKRLASDKESKIKEEWQARMDQSVRDVRKEVQKELQSLKEEALAQRSRITELVDQFDKASRESREWNEKYKQAQATLKREREEWMAKLHDQEQRLAKEQRKKDRAEKEIEAAVQQKDQELILAKERLIQVEREHRRTQARLESVEYELKSKVSSMEKEKTKERADYDELQSKYDQLEKEFVEIKARLVKEKDTLVEAVASIKKSYDQKLVEIKSLRDTITTRQEVWFKEKFNLQAKLQEAESRIEKLSLSESEKNRFKELMTEKDSLIESYRREEKHVKEERDRLRRKCDELTTKIGEMERIERNARTMSITGKTQIEKELADARIKLDHQETSHKGEVAGLRAEYEGRMQMMADEMTELQKQIASLVKDRDYYKGLMGGGDVRRHSKLKDDVEDLSAQLITLRDQLEQALMENRNLKIQHGCDRSTWQVQMAEMKTKVNQLEERLLLEGRASGSTARSYIRTKMELAWEKERQEQQKLLLDTQKFIQEMRDKLVQMETLKEKDRQEARKQLNELKEFMDKEQEDGQRRIGELQLDLVEVRDQFAKIQSQNQRLRRERDAYQQEREEWKLTIFAAIDIQNKAKEAIEKFEELGKLIPQESEDKSKESTPTSPTTSPTSTAPRIIKKKTPTVDMQQLRQLSEAIKRKLDDIKTSTVPVASDDQLKSPVDFRRAVSASEMNTLSKQMIRLSDKPVRVPPRPKAMAKKCLSLDQAGGLGAQGSSMDRVWESDDSAQTTPTSSVSNLRYYRGFNAYTGYESESSVSRFGREGSYGEGSDVSAPPILVRPKKSLKEKLGLSKKSPSIEDTTTGAVVAGAGIRTLALHGFEASPLELASRRLKKENSIKTKISKTLARTFGKSASEQQLNETSPPPVTSRYRPTSTYHRPEPSSFRPQSSYISNLKSTTGSSSIRPALAVPSGSQPRIVRHRPETSV